MEKLPKIKTDIEAKQLDEVLSNSGVSEHQIKGITEYYTNTRRLDESIQLVNMCSAGLSLKEAIGVIDKRKTRSNNVSIRMSDEEVELLDKAVKAFMEAGLIKEGRTDAIVYVLRDLILPQPSQLSIQTT